MIRIFNEDCLDYLDKCEPFRCAFSDIPDNIGRAYKGFSDQKSKAEYRSWVLQLLLKAWAKADIVWLSYNQTHDLWIKSLINSRLPWPYYCQIIWTYTFGMYADKDFTSDYRPIFLMAKRKSDLNFDAIRVVSERMKIDDVRASGLRVPGDVWEFPRVVGNAKEKRAWHTTQHPEALMTRIALLSCTQTTNGKTTPIGKMVDLCLGSGTTAIVCKRLGIDCDGVEISKAYYKELKKIL